MTETEYVPDWTCDAHGTSNSSQDFRRLSSAIAGIIHRSGAGCLSEEWARKTAGLILARLAHVHHLSPISVEREPQTIHHGAGVPDLLLGGIATFLAGTHAEVRWATVSNGWVVEVQVGTRTLGPIIVKGTDVTETLITAVHGLLSGAGYGEVVRVDGA